MWKTSIDYLPIILKNIFISFFAISCSFNKVDQMDKWPDGYKHDAVFIPKGNRLKFHTKKIRVINNEDYCNHEDDDDNVFRKEQYNTKHPSKQKNSEAYTIVSASASFALMQV